MVRGAVVRTPATRTDEASRKGGAEGTVPCHVYREAKDFEENK